MLCGCLLPVCVLSYYRSSHCRINKLASYIIMGDDHSAASLFKEFLEWKSTCTRIDQKAPLAMKEDVPHVSTSPDHDDNKTEGL